jgi:hypothetical protein
MRYHTEPKAQKQESKMHKEIRLNVKVSTQTRRFTVNKRHDAPKFNAPGNYL